MRKIWFQLPVVLRNQQGSYRMTVVLLIRDGSKIKTYKILSEFYCLRKQNVFIKKVLLRTMFSLRKSALSAGKIFEMPRLKSLSNF